MLAGLQFLMFASMGMGFANEILGVGPFWSILVGGGPALFGIGYLYRLYPRSVMVFFMFFWAFVGFGLTYQVTGDAGNAILLGLAGAALGFFINRNYIEDHLPAVPARADEGPGVGTYQERESYYDEEIYARDLIDEDEAMERVDAGIVTDAELRAEADWLADKEISDRLQAGMLDDPFEEQRAKEEEAAEMRAKARNFFRQAEADGDFTHYTGHLLDLANSDVMTIDTFRRVMAQIDPAFDLSRVREEDLGDREIFKVDLEKVTDLLRARLISAEEFEHMRDRIEMITVFEG